MELYLTNHNFIEKVRRFEQGTVYERMAVSPEDFCLIKLEYLHTPTKLSSIKSTMAYNAFTKRDEAFEPI